MSRPPAGRNIASTSITIRPGLLYREDPALDLVNPALAGPRPFRSVVKPGRPFRYRSEHLVDPPLETAIVVLQGEIQHVTFLALDPAETERAHGDAKAHLEDEPRLAKLRAARQQRATFGNVSRNDER